MSKKSRQIYIFIVTLSLLVTDYVIAKTKDLYKSEQLTVKVSVTSPQAISAFYEARGFGKEMITILKKQCFVTIYIKNNSNDFIWLDLSKWKFTNSDGDITRLDREYWKNKWQMSNVPLAHQSTFRWTLIPEQLDFHPGEREGGNVILPNTGKPFTITASFPTRADKQGKAITVKLDNIECMTKQ